MNIEGVLPVLKPSGLTSHDVVARARRILGMKRIGHTGTLDPLVTGVLPLCLGKATRIAEYIQDLPKTYRASLRIGLATDTEDLSGNVLETSNGEIRLTEQQVREVLDSFVGEIVQVPPMYSAVKVQGKKLYELARAGKEVEREPRRVTIYTIEANKLELHLPHPEVTFTVQCSKGTYIRTLCADIGKALGYPAVMADLVRIATGKFHLSDCIPLADLEEAKAADSLSRWVVPTAEAINHFPALTVPQPLANRALQGQKLHLAAIGFSADLVRLFSEGSQFLGIFQLENAVDGSIATPVKVFS